ncbi:MAG: NfeD family protein [Acidimicrobiia bacterium]
MRWASRLLSISLLALAAVALMPATTTPQASGPVDVIQVSGPLDERVIDFVRRTVQRSVDEAQVVVLQLDSPGAVSGDIGELIELLRDPPLPVMVWAGPAPAVAYGGAAQLLAASPLRGAAPEVQVGWLWPTVAGAAGDGPEAVSLDFPDVPEALLVSRQRVAGPIPGLVDLVAPSVGQVVVGLDGLEVAVRGETRTLATAEEVVEEGRVQTRPAVEVRFHKPDLVTRTLRLAVRPEAAYFFLVLGLSAAAFEFYAVGPGAAAAVAAIALVLAGYGVAALPVNWWAVAATVGGLGLYVVDFQRSDLGWRSLAGTALLVVGGLGFVGAEPQFRALWWTVVLVVVGVAFFFVLGMTTVVRARFSTRTIGREHLIGRRGVAESDFDPGGVVLVDGARWRATSYRAAGIRSGDRVRVVGVDGVVLAVEPLGVSE